MEGENYPKLKKKKSKKMEEIIKTFNISKAKKKKNL